MDEPTAGRSGGRSVFVWGTAPRDLTGSSGESWRRGRPVRSVPFALTRKERQALRQAKAITREVA